MIENDVPYNVLDANLWSQRNGVHLRSCKAIYDNSVYLKYMYNITTYDVYIDVSSAGNNTRWHKTIIITVQDNS